MLEREGGRGRGKYVGNLRWGGGDKGLGMWVRGWEGEGGIQRRKRVSEMSLYFGATGNGLSVCLPLVESVSASVFVCNSDVPVCLYLCIYAFMYVYILSRVRILVCVSMYVHTYAFVSAPACMHQSCASLSLWRKIHTISEPAIQHSHARALALLINPLSCGKRPGLIFAGILRRVSRDPRRQVLGTEGTFYYVDPLGTWGVCSLVRRFIPTCCAFVLFILALYLL